MFASKPFAVASVLASLAALACRTDISYLDDDGSPSGGFGPAGGFNPGGFNPSGGSNPSGGFGPSGGSIPGGFDPSGGFSSAGGFNPNGGSGPGGFDPSGGFGPIGGFGGEGGSGPIEFCGNGVIEPGESCDGANLGGLDCQDFGFANPGGLSCTALCNLNPSGCQAVCGNGVPEPGEQCDDGNLSNGDGCSSTCDDEQDPCDVAIPVTLNTMTAGPTFNGSTTGSVGQHTGSCGNATGPEDVYMITTVQDGFVTAWLDGDGTDFDTVLYARTTCTAPGSNLGCHDNDAGMGAGAGEVVSNWMPAGSTLFIVVDGAAGASGDYELHLDLSRGGGCPDPAPITVQGSAPIVLSGSTASLTTDTNAFGCGGAGNGNDSAYQVTFTDAGSYTFDIQSSVFNTVAHARTNCNMASSEVDCDNPPGNDSQLNFTVNAGDTRFVWVDANSGVTGAYTMTITH